MVSARGCFWQAGAEHWLSDRPRARCEGRTVTKSHPPWWSCALSVSPSPLSSGLVKTFTLTP